MKPAEQTPTIDDVARQAGVSTATVSRCLNEPDRVLERTRSKVRDVIDQLGYAPNFGAQALASNRTNAVGAVIPTMDNAIFARGLQAFQETLSGAGVTLLVSSSDYRADKEFEQIRVLVGRGVDGLLLIGRARPAKTYEFLRQRKTPFVLAWGTDPGSDNVFAGFDNRSAARAITDKVLAFGHNHIAMIGAKRQGNDRASDRFDGVLDGITAAGFDPERLEFVESAYTLDAGADAFARLMRRSPHPTAVICGNDVLAAGALGEATRLGVSVPKSVSIVGFDDIDLARATSPQITTVHVPHRRMGIAAAELLLSMRKGKQDLQSVTFDTEIVLRQSLGPAPV